MKLYSFVSFFALMLSFSAYGCPKLAGAYWCVIDDGHREPWLDVLKLSQWEKSDEPGVTYFSSEYRSIPGGTEVFRADAYGIPDQWGWITKCTKDRVISVTSDYSAMSELYLDERGNLVRAENRRIAQNCSPKLK